MIAFRGKVLAAVPVHDSRWLADDPLGRHPLARDGIEALIAGVIDPLLAPREGDGRPLVDGVLLNRFSGVLPEARAIGKRTDGEAVRSACVSPAEGRSYREWLEPVRALAQRTLLIAHDGIPVGPAPLIACAAVRFKRMGISGVVLDGSGENCSLSVRANMVELERRGIVALAEPGPMARLRPSWMGDRPCCTHHEQWRILEQEAAAGTTTAVPEGIDWCGGEDDAWDAGAAAESMRAGRAVAVPAGILTAEIAGALRAAAEVTI